MRIFNYSSYYGVGNLLLLGCHKYKECLKKKLHYFCTIVSFFCQLTITPGIIYLGH